MPIKIFAAPGDHRSNFEAVETQFDEWIEAAQPAAVLETHCMVNAMPEKSTLGEFMLTMVVRYE